jgi:redox-sensing transcriptional repressor
LLRLKKTVHNHADIPRRTIYRFSSYVRCLARLRQDGLRTVSSEGLAKAAGVKPTQLRKDLTYLGQFGTRGLGYEVEQLCEMMSELLGINSLRPVILVGVGNLGLALLSYRGFEQEGFEIIACFDNDLHRHRGRQVRQPIYGMDKVAEIARTHQVRMAILTVPPTSAQDVANHLVESGITGILNFAPVVLDLPPGTMVHNVNLAIELENLSYFINQ